MQNERGKEAKPSGGNGTVNQLKQGHGKTPTSTRLSKSRHLDLNYELQLII